MQSDSSWSRTSSRSFASGVHAILRRKPCRLASCGPGAASGPDV